MRQGRNTLKILSTYCSNTCQFVFQFNPNFNKCLFLNNSIMKPLIFFFSLVSCWGAILGLYSVSMGLAKKFCLTFSISSVQFSRSVVSDSLRPHGLQHTRPPYPSPTPRVYSNSCPLSQWCHPTISSSVVPISSRLQSFPASGNFKWVSSSHQVAKVLAFQL